MTGRRHTMAALLVCGAVSCVGQDSEPSSAIVDEPTGSAPADVASGSAPTRYGTGAIDSIASDAPVTTPATSDGHVELSRHEEPPAWCVDVAEWDRKTRIAQLVMLGVTSDDLRRSGSPRSDRLVAGSWFLLPGDDEILRDDRLIDAKGEVEIEPLVALDDEGGRVQRLRRIAGDLPSARDQAADMRPADVRALARSRGILMRKLGVDLDFAPVVDVSEQESDDVIGDRSYGGDASVVVTYAGAFADGLSDAGVTPTFKHFPGHGRADGDSHVGPAVAPQLRELERVDLVPYRELLRPDVAVMVGHVDVPGLTDPGVPASLSPVAYELLRESLGFDGLIVTDDLSSMGAITSLVPTVDAAPAALTAGADVVLIGRADQFVEVVDGIARWMDDGRLEPERLDDALRRVVRRKGCPDAVVRSG